MLDQLFDLQSIKGSSLNIMLLGIIYAFVGTFSALLLFPNYVSIMSFAFTAILMIPTIGSLIQKEENVVASERHYSPIQLLKDHKDVIRLYILIFLGVFLAYSAIGLLTTNAYIEKFFLAQLKVAGIAGNATNLGGEFFSILFNNILVLAICFVLSLAYGSGSILFIIWNASVWGIVFGYFVRQSLGYVEMNSILYFIKIFLPFIPHLVTEASSYIVAAIMGGVIAKAIIREKLFSKQFNHILVDGLMLAALGFGLVILAAAIEVFFFPLFL